jgi:DNA-binding FadR family transcriptional regulator
MLKRQAGSAASTRTLHRVVLDALAADIAGGAIGPGQALPTETELCQTLQVGRSTLREAIRVLVDKGMLEVRTRAGTRVRPRSDWRRLDADVIRWTTAQGPDTALFADLIEARRIFEPEAAALAARRAPARAVAEIERHFHAMEAAGGHDVERAVEADIGFHTAILAASGNSVLMEFETVIDTALRAAFRISAERTHSPAATIAAHQAVLEAIRLRQGSTARNAMRDLLALAESDLLPERL